MSRAYGLARALRRKEIQHLACAVAAGRLVLNFVVGDWVRPLACGAVSTLTSALMLYRLVSVPAFEVRGAVCTLRH